MKVENPIGKQRAFTKREKAEQKYRNIRQHNMFREAQVLGCGCSTDACLAEGGGEDRDTTLNNKAADRAMCIEAIETLFTTL